MARLRPGWLVALCSAVVLVSAWLPWLVTNAGGGGRANALGGKFGQIAVPPNGFGVGQLIVVLSSTLIVAAAMAARSLHGRIASTAALGISVLMVVLVAWYYRLYVANPVAAGYGLWVGAGAVSVAVVLSVLAMVVAWSDRGAHAVSGFVEPVVLSGERWVSLEPLTPGHLPELAEAAADVGDLWFTSAPTPGTARQWADERSAAQAPGTGLTFVVRGKDGRVLGSSSYCDVDAPNRRLEIGYTWYRRSVRRTGVNTDCKLLMLGHAFDELGCIAVEFRTHSFNSTSRAAIERLGAKLDGVLRSHQLLPDGSRRDTVVYSILDIEWPSVRNNLRFRLDR